MNRVVTLPIWLAAILASTAIGAGGTGCGLLWNMSHTLTEIRGDVAQVKAIAGLQNQEMDKRVVRLESFFDHARGR